MNCDTTDPTPASVREAEPAPESHDAYSRRRLELREKLRHAINYTSMENASNTPDFILAEYLVVCLDAFAGASNAREKWYGKSLSIGGDSAVLAQPPTPVGADVEILTTEQVASLPLCPDPIQIAKLQVSHERLRTTLRATDAARDAELAAVTKKWKACQEWISDYEKTACAEQDELIALRAQLATAQAELAALGPVETECMTSGIDGERLWRACSDPDCSNPNYRAIRVLTAPEVAHG